MTVCVNEAELPQAGGIVISASNIFLRNGDFSAFIVASVTPFPGLPNASVNVRLMTAPTEEFPDRLYDTFMAIDWQFLIGDSSNLSDSDGDGWRDGVDAAPNDPTRH